MTLFMIKIICFHHLLAYDKGMKPSVPETGTVIRREGGNAVIMLQGGKSCKGCGAAKIGLCRAGGTSIFVTADNDIGADVGDTVRIELDKRIKVKGFSLAYLIPLASFITGAMAGNAAGAYLSIPALDIIMGFALLFLASFLSFRTLRKLDKSHRMVVTRIISDHLFIVERPSDEEMRYLKYSGHH